MDNLTFRLIKENDYLKGCLKLYEQFYNIDPLKIDYYEFREYVERQNSNDYNIFVCEINDKIIACATCFIENKLIHLTKNWKLETIISVSNEKNEKLYDDVFISVTCSGTASLEISKRMIPQIVIYKLNLITFFVFSFLNEYLYFVRTKRKPH